MKYLLPLLSIFALVSVEANAQSQSQGRGLCGERAKIVDTLENRYAEEMVSMGLSGSGGVVEVFLSEKGSWTIIMTRPTGRSCVISAGDSWESFKPVKGIEEKI